MDSVPEDRARTIRMCKRFGVWPLSIHRDHDRCVCPHCFGDQATAFSVPTQTSPGELAHLKPRRQRKAFMWEEDYAA